MPKKLLVVFTMLASIFLLGGCTSKPQQDLVSIDSTPLAIYIPKNAQLVPNVLIPTFTGLQFLEAYKIEPNQTCSIQKVELKSSTGTIPGAYIQTLKKFFPGFGFKKLSNKEIKCDQKTYNTFSMEFIIPHADQNYYFYQTLIPTTTKGFIIISCQSTQPEPDLSKIVYNIKCLKNE